MGDNLPLQGLELRSEARSNGELRLTLVPVPVAEPGPDEVVVRVEAAPINPSDLGLLFGPADPSTARVVEAEVPTVVATIPPAALPSLSMRLDKPTPVGNEGAGIVVRAGANAQALLGKTVTVLGGAMFTRYRTVPAASCLVLPDGTPPAAAASAFVNPLTALGMVETMRREGHHALVHTAAASNLGQMLNRICQADGVPLVNIVRSPAQAKLLRDMGARYICDSSAPDFLATLNEAIAETGATLAFDAIGGGLLADQILHAMESAIMRTATSYNRYGSSKHKQVYIYGRLDTGPTVINRGFGFAWGVGGWLLTPFLASIDADTAARLRARVAAELTTTFASHYTAEISLAEAIDPDVIAAYDRRATGEKYLINPNKGLD